MAWVFDDHWRLAYATTAARFTYGGGTGELARFAIGEHFSGADALSVSRTWRFGPNSTERIEACATGALWPRRTRLSAWTARMRSPWTSTRTA
jgi:glutathione S-transferase